MAYKKLNLDWDKVNACRDIAAKIVKNVQRYIEHHSTLSIESASLSAIGAGQLHEKKPIANLIITKIDRNRMRKGALYWFGCALVSHRIEPAKLGYKIANDHISMASIPEFPFEKVKAAILKYATEGVKEIIDTARKKQEYENRFETPWRFHPIFAVASDKCHDIKWMVTEELPHIILIGYNKRILNLIKSLKEKSPYIKKTAVKVEGLESPKDALESILSGADIIAHDVFGEIFESNINPKRLLVDANWVKRICAKSRTLFYSECAHVRSIDNYRNAHQVIVCQLLSEKMAEEAGLTPESIAIGHGFDVNPLMEDAFIHELARATLIREIFAKNQNFYLAPRAKEEKNIINLKNLDLFCAASMITEQSVISCNHIPHLPEILKNALLVLQNMKTIGDEIFFNPNGKISRRAHVIIENTFKTLIKIEQLGMWDAIYKGQFGKVMNKDNEVGLDGLFQKERNYFNPVEELLKEKHKIEEYPYTFNYGTEKDKETAHNKRFTKPFKKGFQKDKRIKEFRQHTRRTFHH